MNGEDKIAADKIAADKIAAELDRMAVIDRWAMARGMLEGTMFGKPGWMVRHSVDATGYLVGWGNRTTDQRFGDDHAVLVWAKLLGRPELVVELGRAVRVSAATAAWGVWPQWQGMSKSEAVKAGVWWCDVGGCEGLAAWRERATGHARCNRHSPKVPNGDPDFRDALDVLATRLQSSGDAFGLHLTHWLAGEVEGLEKLAKELYLASPLTCPTCKPAGPERCCSCGMIIPFDKQTLAANPYAEDIHGDSSLHLMCEGCCEQASQDI